MNQSRNYGVHVPHVSSFVGSDRVNSCMWLLFGHRAGCEQNQLVLVFDALAV